MNGWKLFGKALAATIGVFIVTAATILIMSKCPVWLRVTISFLVVFGLFYNVMRRDYYNGDDNDRLSWNNDDDEEDEK